MGESVPVDPKNYAAVMRRIQQLLEEGSLFIPPHARRRMEERGWDDTDLIQVLTTGRIRPSSHSKPSPTPGGDGSWSVETWKERAGRA
jgi:hypothetical protein